MGTDMHGGIENITTYEHSGSKMVSCFAELEIDRDYTLFALIAGVRANGNSGILAGTPKGFPIDASSKMLRQYSLIVSSPEGALNAAGYVAKGLSTVMEYRNGNIYRISDPDWHSATWLSLDELKTVKANYDAIEPLTVRSTQLNAWIAAMEALKTNTVEPRLVAWFGN